MTETPLPVGNPPRSFAPSASQAQSERSTIQAGANNEPLRGKRVLPPARRRPISARRIAASAPPNQAAKAAPTGRVDGERGQGKKGADASGIAKSS